MPDASGYHLWGWRRVFESAFGHETVYLAAREHGRDRRHPAAGRSSAAGCSAISPCRCRSSTTAACVAAGRRRRRARWSTRPPAVADGRPVVARRAAPHLSGSCRDLPVRAAQGGDARCRSAPTAARAWDALDRKVRNQVRKAEKSGLTCAPRRRGAARSLLRRVRAQHARPRHAGLFAPLLRAGPRRPFPRRPRVFLVEHGDTYGGRRDRARASRRPRGAVGVVAARVPRQCPNNLLYWRIIEHAIAAA